MAISNCSTRYHFMLTCEIFVLCQSAQASRLAKTRNLAQQQGLISGSAFADTRDKLP